MQADINLKRSQAYWEPRKVVITALAATAAIFTAFAGTAGYLVGRHAATSQPIIVITAPSNPA